MNYKTVFYSTYVGMPTRCKVLDRVPRYNSRFNGLSSTSTFCTYLSLFGCRLVPACTGSMFWAKMAKAGKYVVAVKVSKLCKLLLRVPFP